MWNFYNYRFIYIIYDLFKVVKLSIQIHTPALIPLWIYTEDKSSCTFGAYWRFQNSYDIYRNTSPFSAFLQVVTIHTATSQYIQNAQGKLIKSESMVSFNVALSCLVLHMPAALAQSKSYLLDIWCWGWSARRPFSTVPLYQHVVALPETKFSGLVAHGERQMKDTGSLQASGLSFRSVCWYSPYIHFHSDKNFMVSLFTCSFHCNLQQLDFPFVLYRICQLQLKNHEFSVTSQSSPSNLQIPDEGWP